MQQRIYTPEESGTLYSSQHDDGILTLCFRDHKTKAPGKFLYDYPDADAAHATAMDAAPRPGKYVKDALKAGTLKHSDKRERPVEEEKASE